MSGKGSRPRPLSVDRKTFDKNWDKIFSNKNTKDTSKKQDSVKSKIYTK